MCLLSPLSVTNKRREESGKHFMGFVSQFTHVEALLRTDWLTLCCNVQNPWNNFGSFILYSHVIPPSHHPFHLLQKAAMGSTLVTSTSSSSAASAPAKQRKPKSIWEEKMHPFTTFSQCLKRTVKN